MTPPDDPRPPAAGLIRAAIEELLQSDARPQSAAQILDRLTGESLLLERVEVQRVCYVLEREGRVSRQVTDGVVRWSAARSTPPLPPPSATGGHGTS